MEAGCPYELSEITPEVFNVNRKTIIVVAGFMSGKVVDWADELRDSWLKLEDVNVIQVSWSHSNKILYPSAVSHTPLVARQITVMLHYLAELNDIHLRDDQFTKNIHFIGHSLGAHIGGFVGKDLGGDLGRITGLDPAGPAFDTVSSEYRLDRSDARLVDVIHSNRGHMKKINTAGGFLVKGIYNIIYHLPHIRSMVQSLMSDYSGGADTAWFGIDQQIGHVDYYLNNGRNQPGCEEDPSHVCDHGRSHDVLIDTLRYELKIKELNYSSEQRKAHRLLALASAHYDDFLLGANLDSYCPILNSKNKHLSNETGGQINSCAIPFDLVTPIDELQDELWSKYQVNQIEPRNKYFLKTLDSKTEFVGDHYLLKLYLTQQPVWNMNDCSLDVMLELSQGMQIEVNLNNLTRSTDGLYPEIIAMPFVQPFNTSVMSDYLSKFDPKDVAKYLSPDDSIHQNLKHYYLPYRMTIAIGDPKFKGFFRAIRHKIWSNDASKKNCSLDIGMVEIHPVVSEGANFAGIYSTIADENLKTPGEKYFIRSLEEQLQVVGSNTEQVVHLSPQDKDSVVKQIVGLVVGST